MFQVTTLPNKNTVYIRVPDAKYKRASLSRELGLKQTHVYVTDLIEVTAEDELALNDLCDALDHLHIHYVDAR